MVEFARVIHIDDTRRIGGLWTVVHNSWYVGEIKQVNKRRTKTENVAAEFVDEVYGTTWGHFIADPETYGLDKEWVLLEVVPIELHNDQD